ncbi:MAG: anti-sigma factor family protein [Armatimonadota bacterium]
MRCAQVREKLTEYQLDLLKGADQSEVQEHLQECGACREELASLERLDALIDPAEPVAAPANMWSGVQSRMKPRRRPWWQVWRDAPKPALAMAAAMLLAVAGVWLGLSGGPSEVQGYEVLASDYQEQQIVAQWSQPLADDAALGVMFAGLNGSGEAQ